MNESTSSADGRAVAEAGRTPTRRWWLFLLTGILWIVHAFVALAWPGRTFLVLGR